MLKANKQKLYEIFEIEKGITSVIGGGGKTTTLKTLAEDLSKEGHNVLLSTSTHIFPFKEYTELHFHEDEKEENIISKVQEAFLKTNILSIGTPTSHGKLKMPPIDFNKLLDIADYIILEADGSKHLPFKAHNDNEPVILKGSKKSIYIVGGSGFNKPLKDVCHRTEKYMSLTGLKEDDLISPEYAAMEILKENLADIIFINQIDNEIDLQNAYRFASYIEKSNSKTAVVSGSLLKQKYYS